jgi:hypothetical protein
MLGLFQARLPIDTDEFEWMLACFRWFTIEFEADGHRHPNILTLPDAETFPPSRASGHRRAVELFEIVRQRAGMADWQCDLLSGPAERESRVATGLGLRHISKPAPLGTFGYADGRYRITYNPSDIARPESLVATFAHELAHYLLHTARTPPPGGRDLLEHATDLGAVYLGFGLFMANSAKDFAQFQDFGEQGWRMRSQGYLSEMALTTALAVFMRLSDSDAKAAERELKGYLRSPFRKALNAIDRLHPDLRSAVAAIELSDWTSANDS